MLYIFDQNNNKLYVIVNFKALLIFSFSIVDLQHCLDFIGANFARDGHRKPRKWRAVIAFWVTTRKYKNKNNNLLNRKKSFRVVFFPLYSAYQAMAAYLPFSLCK